jgi:hypothetical protein
VLTEGCNTGKGCKDPSTGQSQLAGEAEDSLIRGTPGRVGAVLTTTGRSGTTRQAGSGKRRGKVYERNRRLIPRKRCASSNLVDMGWCAVRDHHRSIAVVNSVTVTHSTGRRPVGKPAAYHWRCCRGRVGHLIREPVCSEPGNHPWSPYRPDLQSGRGQDRCRLTATAWDGGPVVVRARESRVHGEGVQQVKQPKNWNTWRHR